MVVKTGPRETPVPRPKKHKKIRGLPRSSLSQKLKASLLPNMFPCVKTYLNVTVLRDKFLPIK